MGVDSVKLSAVIPTHNRPEVLRRCLESLQAQRIDPTALEVVVVDDGSTGDVWASVKAAASGPVTVRFVRQELAGLNAARNRGASLAGGDILAFLDDDTIISPGWASALIDCFSNHPCAGVGGRVELTLEASPEPWMIERAYYLAQYDLGEEARWLTGDPAHGGDPLPVGANCAIRRSEFDRLGGFRPGLDRRGRSLVSNGDTEFFRRLRASGGRLRYEPAAQVLHRVPAERLTLRYFLRRRYAQGVSDELMLFEEGAVASWRRRLRLARLAAGGVKMLGEDVLHGRGPVNGLFEITYWAGRAVGHGRSVRAPR
jgi:glycosyltransferase involved in cell wall biosynthesis